MAEITLRESSNSRWICKIFSANLKLGDSPRKAGLIEISYI